MKINVCLSLDNTYIKQLICTLLSILRNANNDDYFNFFILQNNLSIEDKDKITELVKTKNCQITFIYVDYNLFNDLPSFKTYTHISKAAYFRLFMADLLKDIDKVIYLDCDTIILSSLKDLFMIDIENYYIAAIEDFGYYFNCKTYKQYQNFKTYINSGVLLINLKLWRKDKLQQKFISIIQENSKVFICYDQDALGLICKNKIKLIDYSWNLQTNCYQYNISYAHPKKKEINKSKKNIKIIHYINKNKPWHSYTPLRKYYLEYEKLTPFKTNYNLIFKIKIFIQFIEYKFENIIWLIRFFISPIIEVNRENNYIKITIFKRIKFNLLKYK